MATGAAGGEWNAMQYLRFELERTRPSHDLLSQVELQGARRVVDLGCGPGNSTALLAERFPEAVVVGVDTSRQMLEKARERLPESDFPRCRFVEADLVSWTPPQDTDLIFANAVLQWIPEHQSVMQRLLEALPEGGVLAVQMPDNTGEPSHQLMQKVALRQDWAEALAPARAARMELPAARSYYDLLQPLCRRVEIWRTEYEHVIDGPQAIVEWFKGSSLRPFLAALNEKQGAEFLQAYGEEIASAYPPRVDGRTLLCFPRRFVVASR